MSPGTLSTGTIWNENLKSYPLYSERTTRVSVSNMKTDSEQSPQADYIMEILLIELLWRISSSKCLTHNVWICVKYIYTTTVSDMVTLLDITAFCWTYSCHISLNIQIKEYIRWEMNVSLHVVGTFKRNALKWVAHVLMKVTVSDKWSTGKWLRVRLLNDFIQLNLIKLKPHNFEVRWVN